METALDCNPGTICINSSLVDIDAFRQRMQQEQAIAAQLETLRRLPAQTMDGVQIPMHVKLGIGTDDLPMRAKEYRGLGLHRTAFFLSRATRFPRRMNSIGLIPICWNPSRQNRWRSGPWTPVAIRTCLFSPPLKSTRFRPAGDPLHP